ncbi:MAG: radical SAM-associated putative lipoprotein [Bacteroidaceae bacterium]|nr:radical SAM-associated putative lipoprotein [Bacteroidaceae bacterium]
MKPEKKTLLARLCAAVLALLGFASCERIWDARTEYGVPSVDFKVKGTVTDEASSPLEGIRVIVRREFDNWPSPKQSYVDDLGRYHEYGGDDTLYTDARGKYESRVLESVSVGGQKVYFDDVDSKAHAGVFESDSVLIKDAPKEAFNQGDGHWYQGGYAYTVDVKLKKKENQGE